MAKVKHIALLKFKNETSQDHIMTFADVTARDAYLPHPDHERFQKIALPLVDSVIVFDFEV